MIRNRLKNLGDKIFGMFIQIIILKGDVRL